MKTLGAIFIGVGLAVLAFIIYTRIQATDDMISPLPDNQGIKVIHISPTK